MGVTISAAVASKYTQTEALGDETDFGKCGLSKLARVLLATIELVNRQTNQP